MQGTVLLLTAISVGLLDETASLSCYSCDRTSSPRSCKNVVSCKDNEACSVQEVLQPHDDVYFWSGCESLDVCSRLAESAVDNTVLVGKRDSVVKNRCAYCCSTDNCNLNCSSFVNLALNKPAYQSSVAWKGHAHLAVDGNTEQNFFRGTCIHTNIDHYAWWAVDLEDVYYISSVKIYNRNDVYDYRMFHLRILVSYENATALPHDSPNFTECGTYFGHSSLGNQITVHCPSNTTGQWVRVQQDDPNIEYFHFCEVEVFGYQ